MTFIHQVQLAFIHSLHQLRQEGFHRLPRRLLRWLEVGLAVIVVLLVRLIRPIKTIRFGIIASIRIGHFASEPELYLCMREAGLLPQKTLDLFWYSGTISNAQLKKMWDRTLHTSPFYQRLYLVTRQFFQDNRHLIARLPAQDRDVHGLLHRTAPHLKFTTAEEREGRAALREMGIEDNSPFFCFHSRDSGYSALGISEQQIKQYGCRNSDLQTYMPAVRLLLERGYRAVRMGISLAQQLPIQHPHLIDYSARGRSDFLDIYLLSKCQFYLGDTCGLAEVPKVFRRPVAWVNLHALEYAPTWGKNDLFLPQKCWLKAENRLLTFREILESGIGRLLHCHEFEERGIQLIPNTAAEIQALAQEMDDRLNGRWQPDPLDEELQARFWSLFKPSDINGVFLCRIGAAFLREHQHLLS